MGLRHSKKCEILPELKALISSEKLMVFIVSNSKSCFECLQILKTFLVTPFIISIDHEQDPLSLKQGLFQITGTLAYPQIFISNKFFGSVKELKHSIKTQKFSRILSSNQIQFQELSFEDRQTLLLNSN